MNHDAAHCLDADGRCPKDCYRFRLTEEYRQMKRRYPVTWSNFEGTDECKGKNKDDCFTCLRQGCAYRDGTVRVNCPLWKESAV